MFGVILSSFNKLCNDVVCFLTKTERSHGFIRCSYLTFRTCTHLWSVILRSLLWVSPSAGTSPPHPKEISDTHHSAHRVLGWWLAGLHELLQQHMWGCSKGHTLVLVLKQGTAQGLHTPQLLAEFEPPLEGSQDLLETPESTAALILQRFHWNFQNVRGLVYVTQEVTQWTTAVV